ncbi:PREDICTED: glycine N-acyltransferase-like protein 2 [Bison bison bison]|uniref:Glycine N-acyltransferase-like protein n=1 Tax=Bison bison bison TaxID=43346 RepID=A0A6P3IYK0_BISBB|nr:PREDICTED: glycine N-acyltransferase-like protein 2 [Bison bison bison]
MAPMASEVRANLTRGWTPALFHIRNKNPFNLEVLVDAWPEYQTVVIRPQKEIVIRGARTQCCLQWPPGASQQQGADRRLGAQQALRPGASVGSGAMAPQDVMLILQMRKRSLRKETFQKIFLNVLRARLVNEHWELGKNEKSLKYVECCLQNFEGFEKKKPFYIHVAKDKEKTQQILLSFGFKNVLCGWHQWKCTPKKYC